MDIRANDSRYMRELGEKTKRIAKNAAEMAGCTVEWLELLAPLDSLKRHPDLDSLYYKHALEYLPKITTPDQAWSTMPIASTDVGNVSQLIPTSQLLFKIGREGLPGHSEKWKQRAGTVEAEEAMLTSVAIAFEAIREYLLTNKS